MEAGGHRSGFVCNFNLFKTSLKVVPCPGDIFSRHNVRLRFGMQCHSIRLVRASYSRREKLALLDAIAELVIVAEGLVVRATETDDEVVYRADSKISPQL